MLPSTINMSNEVIFEHCLEKLDNLQSSDETYQNLFIEYNKILADFPVISNEGLITKAIIKISDTLLSILFKSTRTITRIFKSVGTSEIDTYTQSNVLVISQIFRLPYSATAQLLVPTSPLRMPIAKGKDLLKDQLSTYNKSIHAEYLGLIKNYFSYLEVESYGDLTQLKKEIVFSPAHSEKQIKLLTRLLNIKFSKTAFGKLYNNIDEFIDHYKLVKSYIPIYKQLTPALKTINKIDALVEEKIEYFKSDKFKVSNMIKFQAGISSLSKSVFNIAVAYESFGLSCKILAQQEHFIIQVLSTLEKRI